MSSLFYVQPPSQRPLITVTDTVNTGDVKGLDAPTTNAVVANATPQAANPLEDYLSRLMALIPADAIGLFVVGSGLIRDSATLINKPTTMAIWAVIGAIAVIILRITGTKDPTTGRGVQIPVVVISVISYVIWLYSLGPTGPFPNSNGTIATLIVLAWTFFIPFVYRGSPATSDGQGGAQDASRAGVPTPS